VDRGQVRVRGRVSDPDGDALTVAVAGTDVDVTEGTFATSVAISVGTNEIVAEVNDGRGGEVSASVDIERRGVLFGSPFDLAIHAASHTAWIADFFVGVIELDLETGERRVLDGIGAPPLPVVGVAVTPDGSRIFATTRNAVAGESDAVTVMERARDGNAWSVLAISDEVLLGPLRVDATRNRLIAAGVDVVWAIDLAPGPSRGSLTQIAEVRSSLWMDYHTDANEILTSANGLGQYIAHSSLDLIDLGAGTQRQVWRAAEGTEAMAASGVAFNGSSAYVADWSRGVIHSMSLSSGAMSMHSGPSDFGPQLMLPEAMMRLDATLYVIDSGLGALFSIDSAGARTVVTARSTGTGQGFFGPTGLTYDPSANRFLIMDSDPRAGMIDQLELPSRASLVQVDRGTANRRVVSGAGTGDGALLPWGTSVAIHPDGFVLATTNSSGVFANDVDSGALLEIDLESGERSVVSGNMGDDSVRGTGPSLDSALQVIAESATHALVLQRNKIVRVHLPTGNRTIISGPDGSDVQGDGPAISGATGFVLDDRTDPPLAYVAQRGAILEIQIGSGQRRFVSADTDAAAGPVLRNPGGIALDTARDRVLVVTPELFNGRDIFIEVSLEDGVRRFLSAADEAAMLARTQNAADNYDMASGLYFDEEARVLWAVDWSLRSLQALDADSGETVLFSHFGR
jgi:hypothetical protein